MTKREAARQLDALAGDRLAFWEETANDEFYRDFEACRLAAEEMRDRAGGAAALAFMLMLAALLLANAALRMILGNYGPELLWLAAAAMEFAAAGRHRRGKG